MTNPTTIARNVLVCAAQWAACRQKLRDLTARVKDLSDRKSATKEDYTRLKKDLDSAQRGLLKSAEKLESAASALSGLQRAPKRPKKTVNIRKIAHGVGMLASALEHALAPPGTAPLRANTWKPPLDAIDVDVEVIDATPPKKEAP